jgi:hypothetical protein
MEINFKGEEVKEMIIKVGDWMKLSPQQKQELLKNKKAAS